MNDTLRTFGYVLLCACHAAAVIAGFIVGGITESFLGGFGAWMFLAGLTEFFHLLFVAPLGGLIAMALGLIIGVAIGGDGDMEC